MVMMVTCIERASLLETMLVPSRWVLRDLFAVDTGAVAR